MKYGQPTANYVGLHDYFIGVRDNANRLLYLHRGGEAYPLMQTVRRQSESLSSQNTSSQTVTLVETLQTREKET